MQNLTLKVHAWITLCLALLFIWPAAHAQTTYNFTRIDHDSMSIASGGPPSVSDSGRVAFSASVPGRGSGIFSGTGQEQELNDYLAIATNQPGFFPGDPGSYVGSRVAFWAQLDTGNETDGCFSSDGFVRQTIIVDPTIQKNGSNPWMNRAGQVAYHGGLGDPVPGGHPGFYVGQNGSRRPVYTVPATSTLGAVEMFFVGETLGINDAGKIVFTGGFRDTSQTIDLNGLLQGDVSGRVPSVVVEHSLFGLIDMRQSAANNSGQVVFVGSPFLTGSHPNLFKVSGGKITTLVDTTAGPAAAIGIIEQVAINDAGQVVYVANYKNAAGQFRSGLFTGPDLVNDKIPNDPDRFGHAATLGMKVITVGQGGNGFLTVGPNALCVFVSGLFIGDEGRGVVVVNGANGTFPSDFAQLGGTGFISIGDSSGQGELEIRNGGLVSGSFASMGLNGRRGSAYVIIDGADSRWDVGTDLDMGQNGHSTVELQNCGTLNVAGTVHLQSHGEIKGNGKVQAGRRVENGGIISPGLSPGRLVLEGDYEQTAKGRLKIEVGGSDPGVSHDQFVVHGAATLKGTLELRFINGFAPKQGDTFNFLLVSSNVNNSFSAVEVKNLAPGFQFQILTNGTNISLAAMNDGVFVTPLQARISSSNVVTVGGISYLPYTLNATEDCSLVEPTGAVTRQGQELFQTLSERRDPDCEEGVARVSRTLPLGGLPPGSYHFHFMCDGVVVSTVNFEVPADTGQLLTFARTAGGELALHINGLASVQYTIQTSKDLKEWFDLSAHVDAFLGPYSVFEPFSASKGRFYRVKIE